MKPKVSIAIPVYNVAPYLRRALDSAVNQTMKDIEIICVDDGSTDNSLKILREYAQKDGRIRVIHQENRGTLNARVRAVREAHGDYILSLDPDDELILDVAEKSHAVAVETGADMVGFQVAMVGSWDEEYTCAKGEKSSLNWRSFSSKNSQHICLQPRILIEYLCGRLYVECFVRLISRELYAKAMEKLGHVSPILDDHVTYVEDIIQTSVMAPFVKRLAVTDIHGYVHYKRSTSVIGCRTKTFERATNSVNTLLKVMDAVKTFYRSIELRVPAHAEIVPFQGECECIIAEASRFPMEEFRQIYYKLYGNGFLTHSTRETFREIMKKKIKEENIAKHSLQHRFLALVKLIIWPFVKNFGKIRRFWMRRIFSPLCEIYFPWRVRLYFQRQQSNGECELRPID